jgi:flagellar biosynthesis anti-sigma factor FlgM
MEDRVPPSDRAQAFEEARQAALDVPDVRADRVEALRHHVRNGNLVPDSERIAKALLDQGVVSF